MNLPYLNSFGQLVTQGSSAPSLFQELRLSAGIRTLLIHLEIFMHERAYIHVGLYDIINSIWSLYNVHRTQSTKDNKSIQLRNSVKYILTNVGLLSINFDKK